MSKTEEIEITVCVTRARGIDDLPVQRDALFELAKAAAAALQKEFPGSRVTRSGFRIRHARRRMYRRVSIRGRRGKNPVSIDSPPVGGTQ